MYKRIIIALLLAVLYFVTINRAAELYPFDTDSVIQDTNEEKIKINICKGVLYDYYLDVINLTIDGSLLGKEGNETYSLKYLLSLNNSNISETFLSKKLIEKYQCSSQNSTSVIQEVGSSDSVTVRVSGVRWYGLIENYNFKSYKKEYVLLLGYLRIPTYVGHTSLKFLHYIFFFVIIFVLISPTIFKKLKGGKNHNGNAKLVEEHSESIVDSASSV